MPRLTNTSPPRLLNSEMIVLPHEGHPRPLVCVVTMDTDDGAFEFAMNFGVAEQLAALLIKFMDEAEPLE